jgi:hypothetical protein
MPSTPAPRSVQPGKLPGSQAWWLLLAAVAACQSDAAADQVPARGALPGRDLGEVAQVAEPAADPQPQSVAAPRVVALKVPGYRDAVVAVPAEPASPRPVVVAVHGMYDRVEPFCETWGRVTSGWSFVLCPRGLPRLDAGLKADRWTFGWNGRDLEREIDAGLVSLKHQYGEQVAEGPMIFVGFSLGAIQGADIVLWNPSRFSRAVLVEGGTANWSLQTAKSFARAGGRKLMFACGQEQCVKETQVGLHWLEVAGVDARTAYAGTIGHTYEGIVAEELTRQWSWLTEGDARWPARVAEGVFAP